MKNTRRSFLRLVGAAPLAGKLAAEEAAKTMMGMSAQGAIGIQNSFAVPAVSPGGNEPSPANIANMLLDSAFRAEVESASYRRNRHVAYLDIDLAAKKSFSLAAKVTFQRQRNVQREIEEHSTEWVSPYSLIRKRWNPLG